MWGNRGFSGLGKAFAVSQPISRIPLMPTKKIFIYRAGMVSYTGKTLWFNHITFQKRLFDHTFFFVQKRQNEVFHKRLRINKDTAFYDFRNEQVRKNTVRELMI